MRTVRFAGALVLLLVPVVSAGPGPTLGTENIPKLMAASTLVCKGEVVEAPELVASDSAPLPRRTATAMVHVDRCFKGGQPANGMVPVLFDHIIPIAFVGGTARRTILRKGDYRLYFLKAEEDKYVLVDEWFAQLSVSRQLAPDSGKADPMDLLEMDLKAGLDDSDRDRMLDSVRMLGNMRRLQSKAELLALLDSRDALVRTYVYQALLRLQDYTALPATEEWLPSQPPDPPLSLFLPRDALFYMEFQLASDISEIRDPQHLGTLERLLKMPSLTIRREMVHGIRAMNSMHSEPILLKLLDDPDSDISSTAMQALLELAGGGGPIDWVPTYLQFRDNPKYYAATCRDGGKLHIRRLTNCG